MPCTTFMFYILVQPLCKSPGKKPHSKPKQVISLTFGAWKESLSLLWMHKDVVSPCKFPDMVMAQGEIWAAKWKEVSDPWKIRNMSRKWELGSLFKSWASLIYYRMHQLVRHKISVITYKAIKWITQTVHKSLSSYLWIFWYFGTLCKCSRATRLLMFYIQRNSLVRFVIMMLGKLLTLTIPTKLTISLQAEKNMTVIGYCHYISKSLLKPGEFFKVILCKDLSC